MGVTILLKKQKQLYDIIMTQCRLMQGFSVCLNTNLFQVKYLTLVFKAIMTHMACISLMPRTSAQALCDQNIRIPSENPITWTQLVVVVPQ